MIDRYLWGRSSRVSPEAPVPILDVDRITLVLGGAGNVVNNLKALGACAHVVAVVGEDSNASRLEEMLEDIDASFDLIVDSSRKTTVKTRLMASSHQMGRFDQESCEPVDSLIESQVLTAFTEKLDEYDIVLLSDYGKGLLTESLSQNLIAISNLKSKRVLIDPKGTDYAKYTGAFLLTPNRHEASIATGIDIVDDGSLLRALSKMKNDCLLTASLMTLSEDGLAVLEDELVLIPTSAKEVYDVTGAGDTVLAALGFALGAGSTLKNALVFANHAAAIVVGKIGSSVATMEEILRLRGSTEVDRSNIVSTSEISKLTSELRENGKRIVFTNGCFDILHAGHVQYLQKARAFGDVLVVGLNSDESVRGLKGPGRPINCHEDRAMIVASLAAVDYLVIFGDETPYNLIRSIKPDVLVKGGDYRAEDIVGADIVEDVRIIEFVEGKSTTKTIDRIKNDQRAS